MLSSLIARHVTGTYAFILIPVQLPTPFVEALLPSHLQLSSSSSSSSKSASTEGYSWVVLVAGEQRGTGMSLPGGRSTFFEAKLEIPYLTSDLTSSNEVDLTYKQTLLFSSIMMATSSDKITGLRSIRASFDVDQDDLTKRYEVEGWLQVSKSEGDGEVAVAWGEDEMRAETTGWWLGERSGGLATKFNMTSTRPPQPIEHVQIRMNLAKFAHKSVDQVGALLGKDKDKMDEQGWYDVEASGWSCEERTTMEVKKLGEL